MKVAVIGAGPAGLTAAYRLADAGIDVDVYEKSGDVGGMARSIELWGYTVDIGPHRFFSKDKRVNELWLEVVDGEYEMVDRLTRIYYRDKFFYYPLKPFNALMNLGVTEAIRCIFSFARAQIAPLQEDDDFETWVINRFGRRLYQIFFKTYSEKLWGIPCSQLDADFASQRIKKLSLFEAIKNSLLAGRGNQHKTLVDRFAYPLQGTGMVYRKMAAAIEKNGGKIYLNTGIEKVACVKDTVTGVQLENGLEKKYDKVVSSMPLTQLVKRMKITPKEIKQHCDSLKYRNTIIVYLHVDHPSLFPDNWLYVHSDTLETGRITNFRNWVPSLLNGQQGTVLALEYWCNDDDSIWQADETELIDRAKSELHATNLIGNAEILDGRVYRISKCYPVYESGYKEHLRQIEAFVSSVGDLYAIGRYGAFKYNNQDHSILMGLLVADDIISDRVSNLWEINTDYDEYQESSTITETGLVLETSEA